MYSTYIVIVHHSGCSLSTSEFNINFHESILFYQKISKIIFSKKSFVDIFAAKTVMAGPPNKSNANFRSLFFSPI